MTRRFWNVIAWACLAPLLPAAGAMADDAPTKPASKAAASAPTKKAPAPAAPPTIDLLPYRVLVGIGIESRPEFNAEFRQRLVQSLRQMTSSRLGTLWDAQIGEVAWLQPGTRAVLADLTQQELNDRLLPTDFDKALLATVELDGAGVSISAREWDRNSQTATAPTTHSTYERRVLVERLFGELLAHFRPYAEIEQVFDDNKTVELRIRGGELLPPDASLAPVAAGQYLRPYYRYYDRKKELQRLQDVPWTYIRVTEVTRGRMLGELVSTFRAPLAGSRRRVELMAIAVKPKFDATSLVVYPRGQPQNPLAGTRVDVMDRHPTDDDPVKDRVTLLTGRDGAVQIPADPEQPLRHVYVMSGKSVLAIVPFIPGDAPEMQLEVPDDGARLSVEGEVALLEAELIETVARREVAIARALGHARSDEWQKADAIVESVKRLATKQEFYERLERIRLAAVDAARGNGDRVAEIRINRLCSQFKEAIDRHIDPDRVKGFLQEFSELKQATGAGK